VSGVQDLAALAAEPKPEGALQDAAGRVLDFLGLCLAARDRPEVAITAAQAIADGGTLSATLVGGPRVPAAAAALVNGTAAHALGLDDFHAESTVHPMVTVVPAAMAAAEAAGASGKQFLAAVLFGYEVSCRLGAATVKGVIHKRGFHPTSVLGTVGAAAAAGVALGLTEQRLAHCLAIAATRAAGLFQFAPDTWTKSLQAGWAASAGVSSAQLAARSFTGPDAALEGKAGLLFAFAGDSGFRPNFGPARVDNWAIGSVAYKPYAHGTDLHTPVDALLDLMTEHSIGPAQVDQIEVTLPPKVFDAAGGSAGWQQPGSLRDAQRNLFVTLSVSALAVGQVGLMDTHATWFTMDRLMDPAVQRLATKIVARPDATLVSPDPQASPAAVSLITTSGTRFSRRLEAHRGSPLRPFSWADLTARFRHLSGDTGSDPDSLAHLHLAESVDSVAAILRANHT